MSTMEKEGKPRQRQYSNLESGRLSVGSEKEAKEVQLTVDKVIDAIGLGKFQ